MCVLCMYVCVFSFSLLDSLYVCFCDCVMLSFLPCVICVCDFFILSLARALCVYVSLFPFLGRHGDEEFNCISK